MIPTCKLWLAGAGGFVPSRGESAGTGVRTLSELKQPTTPEEDEEELGKKGGGIGDTDFEVLLELEEEESSLKLSSGLDSLVLYVVEVELRR